MSLVSQPTPVYWSGEVQTSRTPVAVQHALAFVARDQLGDGRREEARELLALALDRVVVALDSQQRSHSREQLVLVERLRHEVVRAGLERAHQIGPTRRGDETYSARETAGQLRDQDDATAHVLGPISAW